MTGGYPYRRTPAGRIAGDGARRETASHIQRFTKKETSMSTTGPEQNMTLTQRTAVQSAAVQSTSCGRRLATVAAVITVATVTLGPTVPAASAEGGNACSVWRCGFNHNEILATSVTR
jgi:hypothetical protein